MKATATDTTIEITRSFDAAPEAVWRAWTTAEGLRGWYAPVDGWIVSEVRIDLRAGGALHIEFGPPDSTFRVVEDWVFDEVVSGERISYSLHLEYDGREGRVIEDTHVVVDIAASGAGTEVRVVESGYSTREARDHHRVGLERMMEHLAAALAA